LGSVVVVVDVATVLDVAVLVVVDAVVGGVAVVGAGCGAAPTLARRCGTATATGAATELDGAAAGTVVVWWANAQVSSSASRSMSRPSWNVPSRPRS
jgi:hypothetical protein